ncbi:MAG: hydroxymethylglutaryl-CoA reductase, degradative [Candidatus Thermoplasmatota archaeon]|nr:hydroxymethylglutaryl-CoA reductase, degradative [Candidatus Thermoplasmatota archaeon]
MSDEKSRLSGFHKKDLDERLELVKENSSVDEEQLEKLMGEGLSNDEADRMIENVVGTYELPVGVATNFKVNGEDVLVPMVIEESSVVAAASFAAKLARENGGFQASSTEPVMISQIQVTGLSNAHAAKMKVLEKKEELCELADEQDPVLVEHGGGVEDIRCRVLESRFGPYLVVHLLVNCQDAMGANAVNTMAEAVAPRVEEITGGDVYLRILSNLAEHRLARARAVWKKEEIGEDTVEGVLQAYEFARVDPYRCATHNKGVMNGVTAVVSATGNDTRAVEAGAHSYAASGGGYSPLTTWERTEDGDLAGTIEIPVPVGTIGGATSSHPGAKANLKIMGVEDSQELGEIIASVGLAQNFGALRALASEGIQKGHMKLHAKNVAVQAGVGEESVDEVAQKMVDEGSIRVDRAKEIAEDLE